MSELHVTTVERAAAAVGPISPLPLLDLLPYQAQDDYDRRRVVGPMRVAVLSNERLEATVALDLGGRVVSLRDRGTGRELLYDNPVVQPANLALRNAWISGGIEWNIGTRGHSPTTMETLHAGRVEGPDATPVLRLWEWERFRGVVFQVDLWLPDGSPALLARTRIRNPNAEAVPMYWWTNVAAVAGPHTRVLAPATTAVRTEYPDRLTSVAVPRSGGPAAADDSYVAGHHHAVDFFYDIAPSREEPWIAAIEPDGSGVAQVSTARLRGRKLFVWGTGPGGGRWQRWLSGDDATPYCEIQAGLAPTQYDLVPLPAGATWEWTEAFGPVQVDPVAGGSDDWPAAVDHVGRRVASTLAGDLARRHHEGGDFADRPPVEVLAIGSGWGALERRRRVAAGEPGLDDRATPFPDSSLTDAQAPWVALLGDGELPAADRPSSYVVGGDWARRLAAAHSGWFTEYHLATIAHGSGDLTTAVHHYDASLGHRDNAWARRGLAELARSDGRTGDAARHAVAASLLERSEWRLAAEAVARLLDDQRPGEALGFIDAIDEDLRARGRLRLLEAFAAAAAGDVPRAAAIVADDLEVPDLREGERSIDALWALVHPGVDVPPQYDFRMR